MELVIFGGIPVAFGVVVIIARAKTSRYPEQPRRRVRRRDQHEADASAVRTTVPEDRVNRIRGGVRPSER